MNGKFYSRRRSFTSSEKSCWRGEGGIFEAKFCLGRGRSRDPRDPQKPRFWACQKVVPPPCKNVQKMGFLGEKACIFGQFVHNFAQK
jgi:hypothetical protein